MREENFGTAVVVTPLENRLDAAKAVHFKDKMRALIETTKGNIYLDLNQVSFLDSSGLGAVVSVFKLMKDGRKLELVAVTPTVYKVLKLTRMTQVFKIHSTLEDLKHAS